MTTALDSIFAAQVSPNILAPYGTDITITDPGATYSPTTGGNVHANVSQTVKGSPPSRMSVRADDPNVERGDMMTVVSPHDPGFTFAPLPSHVATFGGRSYRIVDAAPIYSGDNVAAYKLHLRS